MEIIDAGLILTGLFTSPYFASVLSLAWETKEMLTTLFK